MAGDLFKKSPFMPFFLFFKEGTKRLAQSLYSGDNKLLIKHAANIQEGVCEYLRRFAW